ncbi:hypothetical protein C3E77_05175 [Mycetocola zhujimingii]|nr:hypothetical protein C3E77_05175 [Mycetocola zhujimingii]
MVPAVKAAIETAEKQMARGIGNVLLFVSAVTLGMSSVWSTLTVRQAFIVPATSWHPGTSFTLIPVFAHLTVVLIAIGFTVAVAFRRPRPDEPDWTSRGTFIGVVGATVFLTMAVALLETLGSDPVSTGPVGEALRAAPQPDLATKLLLAFTSAGTFVVIIVFYGVQLIWSYRRRPPEGLRVFSTLCCVLFCLLGAIFPFSYASLAGAAVRDEAVFQDMIDLAATVSEPNVPPPAVGPISGATITAKSWMPSEFEVSPPMLVVCVDEALSLSATHSASSVREGLRDGGIGKRIPELGESCFTVTAD